MITGILRNKAELITQMKEEDVEVFDPTTDPNFVSVKPGWAGCTASVAKILNVHVVPGMKQHAIQYTFYIGMQVTCVVLRRIHSMFVV